MRKQLRLRHYDYTSPGYYYVTICAFNRRHLFGEIDAQRVRLSDEGRLLRTVWSELPLSYPDLECDASVVMPNHFHGILVFKSVVPSGLGQVVRTLKARVSRPIRARHAGLRVWQRNYFEHVVRDDRDLLRIREYIANNPLTWDSDRENARQLERDEFHAWLLKKRASFAVSPLPVESREAS